jgi:hypothetical protein
MTTSACPDWFKLDNAAKIFPAVDSPLVTTMFRLSATLTEPVDPALLQRAVDSLAERFPYFRVTLRSGLFWNYLQRVDESAVVTEERESPCRTVDAKYGRPLLYRVLHFGRKVSVEFSHIMTDGFGALTYLRALVAAYLTLRGVEPDDWGDVLRTDQDLDPEEFEDSYKKFWDPKIPLPPDQEHAFQPPEAVDDPRVLDVTTGISPLAPVLALARARRVSLTEYLAALHLFVLYEYLDALPPAQRRRHLRPIRLVVPVNLRKLFPSRTMRNFLLHVTPGIDPRLGRFTFDEIVEQVHHFMRVEVSEKLLKQQIARNMRGETHPLIRVTPLFLKLPFERMLYQKYGNAIASGVLSNLGPVTMPAAFDERIERFEFVTVPNPDTRTSVGVISHRDLLYTTFGSLVRSREIERRFFSQLRALGVPVKIETTWTDTR